MSWSSVGTLVISTSRCTVPEAFLSLEFSLPEVRTVPVNLSLPRICRMMQAKSTAGVALVFLIRKLSVQEFDAKSIPVKRLLIKLPSKTVGPIRKSEAVKIGFPLILFAIGILPQILILSRSYILVPYQMNTDWVTCGVAVDFSKLSLNYRNVGQTSPGICC